VSFLARTASIFCCSIREFSSDAAVIADAAFFARVFMAAACWVRTVLSSSWAWEIWEERMAVCFLDAASVCRSAVLEADRISSSSSFFSLTTEAIASLSDFDLSPDDIFSADEAVFWSLWILLSCSACALWSLMPAAFNLACRAASSLSEAFFSRRTASSVAAVNSWIFFSFSAVRRSIFFPYDREVSSSAAVRARAAFSSTSFNLCS